LFVGGDGVSCSCARAGAHNAATSKAARARMRRAPAMAQTFAAAGGGAGAPIGLPSRNTDSEIEFGGGLVFSILPSTGRITRKNAKEWAVKMRANSPELPSGGLEPSQPRPTQTMNKAQKTLPQADRHAR